MKLKKSYLKAYTINGETGELDTKTKLKLYIGTFF